MKKFRKNVRVIKSNDKLKGKLMDKNHFSVTKTAGAKFIIYRFLNQDYAEEDEYYRST